MNNNIDKGNLIDAFNHAELYDQYANIQKIIAQKTALHIQKIYKDIDHPKVILEIGCGTGFLTQNLIKIFPNAHFIVTDIAPKMIERVKKKLMNSSVSIQFEILDADNIQIKDHVDLICSSLSFQWLQNLSVSLNHIIQRLNSNGYLIFSTLAQDTFIEWQEIYQKLKYPYSFQRYPSLQDLEKSWPNVGSGWWKGETIIDSQSTGFDFIRNLHKIGAHIPPDGHSPLSYKKLMNVIKEFDKNYGYTSYQVAFGFFRKFSGSGFFVTGTDTDIGKTFISACLSKALNAIYWKPIQTGLDSDQGDTKTVKQLTTFPEDQFIYPLIELQAPLSPEDAATLEGKKLSIHNLDLTIAKYPKTLVIEGAGGVYVPIAAEEYIIDLIKKVNLPVIVVARSGLGTLNHTLMTIEILRNHHIFVAGVILNGAHNTLNKDAIERHGNIKIIAEIPYIDSISSDKVDESAALLSMSLKDMIFSNYK